MSRPAFLLFTLVNVWTWAMSCRNQQKIVQTARNIEKK